MDSSNRISVAATDKLQEENKAVTGNHPKDEVRFWQNVSLGLAILVIGIIGSLFISVIVALMFK